MKISTMRVTIFIACVSILIMAHMFPSQAVENSPGGPYIQNPDISGCAERKGLPCTAENIRSGKENKSKGMDSKMDSPKATSEEALYSQATTPAQEEKFFYMIKSMSRPHCARGPAMCAKCREMEKTREICLLKVYAQSDGKVARPVIEVTRDGQRQFLEFDVEKVFKDASEARAYAAKNKIQDVLIEEEK